MVARRERTAGSENITRLANRPTGGARVFMQARLHNYPQGRHYASGKESERNMARETEMGVFVSELLNFI